MTIECLDPAEKFLTAMPFFREKKNTTFLFVFLKTFHSNKTKEKPFKCKIGDNLRLFSLSPFPNCPHDPSPQDHSIPFSFYGLETLCVLIVLT